MSFGAISKPAILALSNGAREAGIWIGRFTHVYRLDCSGRCSPSDILAMETDTTIFRVVRGLKTGAMGAFLSFALLACVSEQPSLERLYTTSQSISDQPPVILIHGAFGARLCDEQQELWPGNIVDLLFSDYNDLALNISEAPESQNSRLFTCGMTDEVAGQDFYGKIERTLAGPGGYTMARPGEPLDQDAQRFYYRYVYDWRQDNAATAADLDRLVDQIRLDHGNPDLKVDIVAHSMGGLVTRYWLRYGSVDVLNDNEFPINNEGAMKARKIVLVGTPSLGSASALQQLLDGADFGVNEMAPETLLTFPSAYQLLPHPIVDSTLDIKGQPLPRDFFDIELWRALEWGPYDSKVRQRLIAKGFTDDDFDSLENYVHTHLERARRFQWSLTVANDSGEQELIVFGGDCVATSARILIEDLEDDSYVRLWPTEIEQPLSGIDYASLMLEPGDGAVTKASLLARTELDPSIPRHQFSDFPLDYAVMFCEDHSKLPGNITFQDNLLHILLSR